jgi:hypothetical protein
MTYRFQIALMFLMLTTGSTSAAGKRDIRGLSPGMTFSEVIKAMPTTWTCERNKNKFLTDVIILNCLLKDDDQGHAELFFTPKLPGNPLTKVQYTFHAAVTGPEVIRSVSAQYGATPIGVPDGQKWNLGDGYILEGYFSPDHIFRLDLHSTILDQSLIDAAKVQDAQQHPIPKF